MLYKSRKLKFNPKQKKVLDIYETENRKIKIIDLIHSETPRSLYRYYGLNVGNYREITFNGENAILEYKRVSIRNIKFDKQILIG